METITIITIATITYALSTLIVFRWVKKATSPNGIWTKECKEYFATFCPVINTMCAILWCWENPIEKKKKENLKK
jgi:hypothetical protein